MAIKKQQQERPQTGGSYVRTKAGGLKKQEAPKPAPAAHQPANNKE